MREALESYVGVVFLMLLSQRTPSSIRPMPQVCDLRRASRRHSLREPLIVYGRSSHPHEQEGRGKYVCSRRVPRIIVNCCFGRCGTSFPCVGAGMGFSIRLASALVAGAGVSDYNFECPEQWEMGANGKCLAPVEYAGVVRWDLFVLIYNVPCDCRALRGGEIFPRIQYRRKGGME